MLRRCRPPRWSGAPQSSWSACYARMLLKQETSNRETQAQSTNNLRREDHEVFSWRHPCGSASLALDKIYSLVATCMSSRSVARPIPSAEDLPDESNIESVGPFYPPSTFVARVQRPGVPKLGQHCSMRTLPTVAVPHERANLHFPRWYALAYLLCPPTSDYLHK